MDVKTLSTITGHISSATTLDIYSHATDTMQKQAAVKIDHQIGKTDASMPPDEQKQHTDQSGFQPYKSKYRKAGTSGLYQRNDHLWEGNTPPEMPTASVFLEMSTPKLAKNAKKNWR